MTSNELRELFLKFFESRGHTRVASSSLVPGNDPTLLFTNAGMNQFKDVFTGRDKRAYVRAASSQKCVRAGGKHNDLENVGYTARHHTFFEMLGNFSFGDYFKKDAIDFAWEFITGRGWLGIDKSKLMVTVYHTDDEAFELWLKHVPKHRIVRIGDKPGGGSDNFWQMGETGPCGPCSEIFYDHGDKIAGGPPGSPDADGDRWVEIWNLVFMQFDRSADGKLTPLPAPSVDTGMGLERLAAVMQSVHSNYETDVFKALIKAVLEIADRPTSNLDSMLGPSVRAVADHIRATCFLITDGVLPSSDGRGYVLRRIMRRAMRHGRRLTQKGGGFFHLLASPLADVMGSAYPELHHKLKHIEDVIRGEEAAFTETLDRGLKLFEDEVGRMTVRARGGGVHGEMEVNDTFGVIPGEIVFKLYDTYGFPVDLTADIARERGLKLDEAGYEREMEAQRSRARAASSFKAGDALAYDGADTCFVGYETLAKDGVKVLALYRDGQPVSELKSGDAGVVVLSDTPFYAESGGQVGDRGAIAGFEVADTQKIRGNVFGHHGILKTGRLKVGDAVRAEVTESMRRATMRNHSATHLMHSALRNVLGAHVQQKGSLVNATRTRFDFSHNQPVTTEQIAQIEDQVNRAILANVPVEVRNMKHADAIKAGAMALFGEKYGDEVRVLRMGDFSTELCGGTHVSRTGDIGPFKIVSEGGVAAGVRRVEATTGENVLEIVRGLEAAARETAEALKSSREDVPSKIRQLLDRNKQLEKELAQLKLKMASGGGGGGDLSSQVREVKGVKLISTQVDGVDAAALRTLNDQLKSKLGSGIVLLGAAVDGKVALIAGVTADLTGKVKAGELVNFVAQQVGGKGGGRPDMAQAGGTQPEKLTAALDSVYGWVEAKL